MEKTLKAYKKWIDLWRVPLLAWGVFSADLANQPPEYLLTHSFLVEIEKLRPREARHSDSKFKVILSGMRSDDQIRDGFRRIPDPEYRAQIDEGFSHFSPSPGLLRMLVVCYPGPLYSHAADFLRNIFPDGKAASFTDPLSPESRLVSTALARAWAEQFAEHVRTGNDTGHEQVLENLIQDGRVLSEAAFEVD